MSSSPPPGARPPASPFARCKDRLVVYRAPMGEENVRRLELVEALVRWQRPDGLMAPDSFIATAELARSLHEALLAGNDMGAGALRS